MALTRVLAWSALAVLALPLLSYPADPSSLFQPVKRHPGAAPTDPYFTAQIQIARLRQTADQLRLLANQPVPVNAKADTREEFIRHEEWLRRAGHRVNVLANEWEQRVKPAATTAARAADVNSFFELQAATLQSKLHRESLTLDVHSEPVRSAGDTARLVIGKMN